MNDMRVWVVDDDPSIRWVLERALSKHGMDVRCFESAESVTDLLESGRNWPHVILSDIRMPGIDGLVFLQTLQRDFASIPVIIMTAHSDLESTVSAYESGAFDYLPKPFDINQAVETVQRAYAVAIERAETGSKSKPRLQAPAEIIGGAPAMQEVFRAIGRLSRSAITVLINGESGTGKELIAKALHRHSPRSAAPFIALNMSAIPRDLMESELFGHEKGSFTGAQAQRLGRFEQADGGTLFLDEIGDMPPDLQTRLLRVLADGEFFRVGGARPLKVDVRIIAATHQDLESRVEQGEFREDLFHRLNVIRVRVPPLRDRREDIPALMLHFLQTAANDLGVQAKVLTKDVEARLCACDWPGNVRELQNMAHWLTVMAGGREVQLADLPDDLQRHSLGPRGDHSWQDSLGDWAVSALKSEDQNVLHGVIEDAERTLIRATLAHTQGHRQAAAKLLGWGRNTLTRKIKELELDL